MLDLTDRDRRQLSRMAERLDLFTKGDISLRVLIGDLEFLLSALDAVDESIRQQLRGHWEVLEEVYSVSLAMHGGQLDAQGESLVRNSVTALRTRVGELVGAMSEE